MHGSGLKSFENRVMNHDCLLLYDQMPFSFSLASHYHLAIKIGQNISGFQISFCTLHPREPAKVHTSSKIPAVPTDPAFVINRIGQQLIAPIEISASCVPCCKLRFCHCLIDFFLFFMHLRQLSTSPVQTIQYGLSSFGIPSTSQRIEQAPFSADHREIFFHFLNIFLINVL